MTRTFTNSALLAMALLPACLGKVADPHAGMAVGSHSGNDQPVDGGDAEDSDASSEDNPPVGGDFDAATPQGDAGTGGPVVVPSGSVAIIVAAGRGGRTTISCDAGRTWIQNQFETSATARCWGQPDNAIPQYLDGSGTPNPDWIECDHNSGSTTGLVYRDGWFIKSIGWGTDGRTLRSYNGVTWTEPVPTFKDTYLGLVVLGDKLVAMGIPQPHISADNGLSWTLAKELGWDAGHVRKATTSGYGGGAIVFTSDKGVWSSLDGAKSYSGPAAFPCAGNLSGFASSQNVSVLASENGTICTTLDGGKSYTQHMLGSRLFTNPVWNGSKFAVWGDDSKGTATAFTSPDGTNWTSTPMAARVALQTVGTHVSGSFVGTNAIWNDAYEKQRFFRSDDGIKWETLPSTAFKTGHPISHFVSGVVPANTYCPAP